MDQHRHLDLSGSEPEIAGTRISVLDVFNISTQLDSEEAEKTLFDDWGLSESQVEAALDYYEKNKSEMRDIQKRKRKIANG